MIDARSSRLNFPRHARRGSIYVFVLATAMLLTIIGMMVLTTSQISARSTYNANDSIEASVLAESAVDYALQQIANDSNWRSDYTNNVIVTPAKNLGHGTITFKLADDATPPATTLTVTTDPVRIYGIGKIGNTVRVYSMQATPNGPLKCLQNAITANSINLNSSTITGSPTIYANTSITGGLPIFSGAILEGVSISLSSLLNVTANSGAQPEEMPSTTGAFNYYTTNGTAISISSIPSVSGNPTMQNKLLSPASNPFGGGTNSKGIYVINCNGSNLIISTTRVVGTLVILNPGPSSMIQTQNYFAPAVTGYPCLMVQGNITFNETSSNLSDNSSSFVNYNPAGTPYLGATDSTYTTQYPNRFEGLVYVSGNLTTQGTFTTSGTVVVGNTWSSSGTANLTYDATTYKNPPPGFTSGQLAPVTGTWRWEAAQ